MQVERLTYVAASVATTVAGAVGRHRAHAVAKAAMVPALQGSMLRRWADLSGMGRVALPGSTTAALVGDVLLVSPETGESDADARGRLRRGAVAFGVQHLGYLGMLRHVGARPRWRTTVPVAVVLLGLAALDTAKESGPDPVVTAYGLLLGTMSAHALEASDPRIRWGGRAFLASDAMILVREQLVRDRPQTDLAAGAFVMTTYALAQRWLVDGFVDGLASPHPPA